MKINYALFLFACLLLFSCADDDSQVAPQKQNEPEDAEQEESPTDPLTPLIGVWQIDQLDYQFCKTNNGITEPCTHNILDFTSENRTFRITADSVFYNAGLSDPERIERFYIHAFVNDTLKLKNIAGVWDFVVDERTEHSMTVRAVIFGESATMYDVYSLSR